MQSLAYAIYALRPRLLLLSIYIWVKLQGSSRPAHHWPWDPSPPLELGGSLVPKKMFVTIICILVPLLLVVGRRLPPLAGDCLHAVAPCEDPTTSPLPLPL
jgi:hypothetical protein